MDIRLEIIRAGNGAELRKLLNNKDIPLPLLIFLDINMPLKNGFTCPKEIKESSRLKNIFVVILSTSAGSEVIDKMFLNKASRYIIKPNPFDHLKSCVQTALKQIHANEIYSSRENFELTFIKNKRSLISTTRF